jgi:crotonobetainyl-CoA:carnitine CoA-transferase CaiB-like acyl-CoA transferase
MELRLQGSPTGPCVGIKVLDFSTLLSGPMCTMILADLGGDVIKVEPPRGDSTRMMGPPFKGELSAMFTQFNRNKRSVVIDLKHAGGRAVALRLADSADVVVENFRPGVATRLGIDYPSLCARNPGLVYLSISGFGPDGPYVQHPAYDTVIQGLTGHMPIQGAGHSPALIRSLVADKASALTGVYAILAALLARERTGGRGQPHSGQRIDVPMLDAFAAFMLPDAMLRETFLPSDEWQSLPDLSMVHRTWQTADGHAVLLIVEDAQFQGLCRVLEREDWIQDQRFSSLLMRIANGEALFALLEGELRKWPTAVLVERARQFGAPLAPANDLRQFLADPQVAANRTVFESEDAAAGRIRYLRNPVRLSATPPSLHRHPPRLGEHTDEVLNAAGYSDQEITALRANHIVF